VQSFILQFSDNPSNKARSIPEIDGHIEIVSFQQLRVMAGPQSQPGVRKASGFVDRASNLLNKSLHLY
jgi:hypothetical protein